MIILIANWRFDYGSTWSMGWVVFAVAVLAGLLWMTVLLGNSRLVRQQAITLAVLRGASMLILLWMSWGWSVVEEDVVLPELWITLDESQSMDLPLSAASGQGSAVSRWGHAHERLTDAKLIRSLNERFRVRFWGLGDGPREIGRAIPSDSRPPVEHSRLGDDLAELLNRAIPGTVQGIWFFSDGRITSGDSFSESPLAMALGRGIPVHVTPLGDEGGRFDLALTELTASSPAIPGDYVEVSGRFTTTRPSTRSVRVRLCDNQGNVLDESVLSLSEKDGGSRRSFSLGAVVRKSGRVTWNVAMEVLEGEADADNNRRSITIQVRDDPLNVLLVAHSPNYEFRFLKHLLERSASEDLETALVRLTSILQEADPRYADQDQSARRLPPTDEASLEAVDVFVLIDANLDDLGSSLLNRWRERVDVGGAGLLIVAGPRHLPHQIVGSPLSELNPVTGLEAMDGRGLTNSSTPMRGSAMTPTLWELRVSNFGRGERAVRLPKGAWQEIAPVSFLARSSGPRLGAQVLLEGSPIAGGSSQPALVLARHGAGNVAMQLTDEMFRLTSLSGDDRAHEWYWMQLLRRLARGRHAAAREFADLRVTPEKVFHNQTAKVQVSLSPALEERALSDVRVRVETEDRTNILRSIRLTHGDGLWSADFDANGVPGKYMLTIESPQIEDNPPTAIVEVAPPPTELSDTRAEISGLVDLAHQTRGIVFSQEQPITKWLDLLPSADPISKELRPPWPVWNHYVAVLLVIGLLTAEWTLRRLWGEV
jgi:hypothetical protein